MDNNQIEQDLLRELSITTQERAYIIHQLVILQYTIDEINKEISQHFTLSEVEIIKSYIHKTTSSLAEITGFSFDS